MSSLLRVALTGGIGSGKSTVSAKFEELGAPVIDSDLIARDVVKPDKPHLSKITEKFGDELLTDNRTLDREKLRSVIFNNLSAKKELEKILHPAIYQEIEHKIAKIDYPYCLIAIPLLIETKAMDQFDRVLVIDSPESLQIERALKRDNSSRENIEKIIQSQINRKERLKYADDVIENNHTIERLNEPISKLHKKYLDLSSYNFKKNE